MGSTRTNDELVALNRARHELQTELARAPVRIPGGGSGGLKMVHATALHWAPAWGGLWVQDATDAENIFPAINATGSPIWKGSELKVVKQASPIPAWATTPDWYGPFKWSVIESNSARAWSTQLIDVAGPITLANLTVNDIDGSKRGTGDFVSLDFGPPSEDLPWPAGAEPATPEEWFTWFDPILDDPYDILDGKTTGDVITLHAMSWVGDPEESPYAQTVWHVHAPAPKGDPGGEFPYTGPGDAPEDGTSMVSISVALVDKAGDYVASDETIPFKDAVAIVGTAPADGTAANAMFGAFVDLDVVLLISKNDGSVAGFKLGVNIIKAQVDGTVTEGSGTFDIDNAEAVYGSAPPDGVGIAVNEPPRAYANNTELLLVQRNDGRWTPLSSAGTSSGGEGWFYETTSVITAATGDFVAGTGTGKRYTLKAGEDHEWEIAGGAEDENLFHGGTTPIPSGQRVQVKTIDGKLVIDVRYC